MEFWQVVYSKIKSLQDLFIYRPTQQQNMHITQWRTSYCYMYYKNSELRIAFAKQLSWTEPKNIEMFAFILFRNFQKRFFDSKQNKRHKSLTLYSFCRFLFFHCIFGNVFHGERLEKIKFKHFALYGDWTVAVSSTDLEDTPSDYTADENRYTEQNTSFLCTENWDISWDDTFRIPICLCEIYADIHFGTEIIRYDILISDCLCKSHASSEKLWNIQNLYTSL